MGKKILDEEEVVRLRRILAKLKRQNAESQTNYQRLCTAERLLARKTADLFVAVAVNDDGSGRSIREVVGASREVKGVSVEGLTIGLRDSNSVTITRKTPSGEEMELTLRVGDEIGVRVRTPWDGRGVRLQLRVCETLGEAHRWLFHESEDDEDDALDAAEALRALEPHPDD